VIDDGDAWGGKEGDDEDPTDEIVCTDFKYCKFSWKKSCRRYTGFLDGNATFHVDNGGVARGANSALSWSPPSSRRRQCFGTILVDLSVRRKAHGPLLVQERPNMHIIILLPSLSVGIQYYVLA